MTSFRVSSLTRLAFHPESPVHQFGQAFGNDQPNSGARHGAGLLAESIKRLEKLGHIFRTDPSARVFDTDADAVPSG